MKGRILPSEFSEELDSLERAYPVEADFRSCDQPRDLLPASSITPDGRRLIFSSDRSGSAQLYSVEGFPHGPIRQWTAGAPIHAFSPLIHPNGAVVFFVRGGAIWKSMPTLSPNDRVVNFSGAQLGEVSLSACGQWLTAAIKLDGRPGIVTGRVDGSRLARHPLPAHRHPSAVPSARARVDRVRRRPRPAHAPRPPRRHRPRVPLPARQRRVRRPRDLPRPHRRSRLHRLAAPPLAHGLDHARTPQICDFNAWHITPNRAGTHVLCDTNHPDRGLYLIDVATGAVTPSAPPAPATAARSGRPPATHCPRTSPPPAAGRRST